MRIKQKVRICVDFAMILLMPCLMAYSLISGKIHEWLGMAMFLLFFCASSAEFRLVSGDDKSIIRHPV